MRKRDLVREATTDMIFSSRDNQYFRITETEVSGQDMIGDLEKKDSLIVARLYDTGPLSRRDIPYVYGRQLRKRHM